jgi:PhnB protein
MAAGRIGELRDQPMTRLSSYLLFDGTCKEALAFYQAIFGGELVFTTVADSPMKTMFPPALHSRVVHGNLKSDVVEIPASDWLAQNERPVRGNMMCMYVHDGTPDELKGLFEQLSDGGTVTDRLQQQPFGYYDALNDKFGVRWMFHTDRR